MEISEKKDSVEDGVFVNAVVYTLENEKIAENIRMVFPKGTEAEKLLRDLKGGDMMHVLGIPRVNLNEISNLIQNSTNTTIEDKLPFEIIIVGVFN